MKNKYIIIKSLKLSEKDKNKGQKISARHHLLSFPLKTHDTAAWRLNFNFQALKIIENINALGWKRYQFWLWWGGKKY